MRAAIAALMLMRHSHGMTDLVENGTQRCIAKEFDFFSATADAKKTALVA